MSSPPTLPRVLIVDDDVALTETIKDGLADLGFSVVALRSGAEAAKRIEQEEFDALVTDLRMPDVDGLDLLAASRRHAPETPVLVMTAYSAVDTAIESIRRGATHYLTKPFKVDELALFLHRAIDEARVRREAQNLRRTLRDRYSLPGVIGSDGGLRQFCELAERVANADTPLILVGETGSGKSVLARAIHASSGRASAPFVTVNCAALPAPLLESELFGHAKGAFTGAAVARKGLFEEAHGGTLFLDEIAEMPAELQSKFLDVLERRVVRALGSDRERTVDVRVIAATHRDLNSLVASGAFREDLLFRLDVVSLNVPPLRRRQDDIPALVEHFLNESRVRHPHSPVRGLSPGAFSLLAKHDWPGNVRELSSTIERAVLIGRSTEVSAEEMSSCVRTRAATSSNFVGDVIELEELNRRYAAWALDALGGRKMLAAEKLGIDRKTLSRLLGLSEHKP